LVVDAAERLPVADAAELRAVQGLVQREEPAAAGAARAAAQSRNAGRQSVAKVPIRRNLREWRRST
jgi:hypothetical protein